jgi:ankyrin repeat protein
VKQTRDEGRNPIHIAALHGNVLATQTFVSLDAQTHGDPKQRALNAIDNYHQSPLEIAVNSTLPNAAQVAQILIEGDANLTPKHAKHGLLQQAVSSGDPAVVKVIVDVLRNDGIPYQKDKSGRTPLAVFRKKLRGAKESTEQQDRTQAIENILKQYKTPSN